MASGTNVVVLRRSVSVRTHLQYTAHLSFASLLHCPCVDDVIWAPRPSPDWGRDEVGDENVVEQRDLTTSPLLTSTHQDHNERLQGSGHPDKALCWCVDLLLKSCVGGVQEGGEADARDYPYSIWVSYNAVQGRSQALLVSDRGEQKLGQRGYAIAKLVLMSYVALQGQGVPAGSELAALPNNKLLLALNR